jgi:heptosyltransferase-2
MTQDIERILILRTDGIGDVLNCTPAISALRYAYRDAHISAVVRPPGAEILFLNPHIDEILVYDVHGLHKSPIARLRFLRHLWAGCYDMAVVLHNSSLCNLMAYLSRARYRIGRKSERKRFSFTLTHGVSSRDPKGTKHEIDRNMDIVRLIGACEDGAGELVLRLSEEERAWARDFLCRQGVGARHASPLLVGIHPGGSSFDKLWPAENFAHVATRLMQELEARIILFSGPGEDDLVRSIRGAIREERKLKLATPVIFTAGLRLRQLAALIEKCSLFICNDSGPMHIAAALKIPTVAVFGPTDHVRWKPRSENAVIVRRDMDCWPCSAHKCKRGFECIKSLPVGDVLDAGYSMLNT